MGEHQAGDVAANERHDLDVPDRGGADRGVVDAAARGAEVVGAVAERIRQQIRELR